MVYDEGAGAHLSANDASSAVEQLEFPSLTAFLNAYPASAEDAELLAVLVRGAAWPAEAMWPELWSLKGRGVLGEDVVVRLIGSLWGAQPDLARVAVVGDPEGVGLRLVTSFPAVWPALARWAHANELDATRIGRLVSLLVEAYEGAAGQVVAAMSVHAPGMAVVAAKAGLRRHAKGVEVLACAVAAAPPAEMGTALAAWLTNEPDASGTIGHALALVPDWPKAGEVLRAITSATPADRYLALWLAMWARADASALRALLVAGRSQPDWLGGVVAAAVTAGVPPEALISGILQLDPQATSTAVAVVLALAGSPERIAAMIGEPLDSSPATATAIVAAVAAAPEEMTPTITALLAARRREAVAAILTRIPVSQAAIVLARVNWTPAAFVRLLPRLQAHHPEAFKQLVATLSPTTLATAGLALANTGQWVRIATLIADLETDAGALVIATVAAHDADGGVSIALALADSAGPEVAGRLLTTAHEKFGPQLDAVAAVLALGGDTPARSLLVSALAGMPAGQAGALLTGILIDTTGRAGDAGTAADTGAALLLALHRADPDRGAALLAHILTTLARPGHNLCVSLIDRIPDGSTALAAMACADDTLAAAIITTLVTNDPDGHLLQRLRAAPGAILRPSVLNVLAANRDHLAHLLATLNVLDDTDLQLTLLAALPADTALDVLTHPALAGRPVESQYKLLGLLLAKEPELTEEIVTVAFTRRRAAAAPLVAWLAQSEDQNTWALFCRVSTPQTLIGLLPNLAPDLTSSILRRLVATDEAFVISAIEVAAEEAPYIAARALVEFAPVRAADHLLQLPVDAARRILGELNYTRMVQSDHFLTRLGNGNPALIVPVIAYLSPEKAAEIICTLNATSLQAIRRDVLTRVVRRLDARGRERMVGRIAGIGLEELATYLDNAR